MNGEEMAAVVAKTEANAREIERLRERSHEFGNELQRATAVIDNLDRKMDAQHASTLGRIAEMKGEFAGDLAEIKTQTTLTNGRVKVGELADAELRGKIRGMAIVFAAGSPFLVTAVGVLIAHFIH
jgi:hypothetical protein